MGGTLPQVPLDCGIDHKKGDHMLIYRGIRDDGSMLAYKIAMRQLDRVERNLRSMRGKLGQLRVDTRENSDIIQVAINRAVNKRIELVHSWWRK